MKISRISTAVMVVALLCISAVSAEAISTTWTAGNTYWHGSGAWSNGVPGASDWAYIQNGGTAIITNNHAVDELYLGYSSSTSGFVTQLSGQFTSSTAYVGRDGTGHYTLSGGTHTATSALWIAYRDVGGYSSYTLNNSGVLSAGSVTEYVGNRGAGYFLHNNGTNTAYKIVIANKTTGYGVYQILNGNATATLINVGEEGEGLFTHRGGTVRVNSGITLGNASSGDGSYTLSSGATLSAHSIVVGDAGVGVFNHNDGAVLVDEDMDMALGFQSGSRGIYNMHDGTLDGNAIQFSIGYEGTGTFNQFGGTHTIIYKENSSSKLYIGRSAGSTGTYNLYGGQFITPEEAVGRAGTGTFNQSGGTHTVKYISVGVNIGSVGNYTFTGGSLAVTDGDLNVSSRGTAVFTHSAGTSNITNSLHIGRYEESTGSGIYNLSGTATLIAGNTYVGHAGTGTLTQTGGTHTIAGILDIGYSASSDAAYNMGVGTLSTGANLNVGVSGAFNITNNAASITVGGDLSFAAGAQFSAVAGSTIHLTGSNFYNESTSASDMAGLGNTDFIFEGGAGVLDTFEVAGEIDGGFSDNFAIGALTMGGSQEGHLQLVDATDNGNRGTEGEECLFVTDLTINSGSSLDVNGFILYESGDHAEQWNIWIAGDLLLDGLGEDLDAYYDSSNDWTTFSGVVPEPGTMILIGAAMAGLAGVVRKRMIK